MIRIERLHFAVGAFALCDVSLHVAPGEYFVLLGPTGSGKTLLVECLCGLNRIDSGRILLAGEDVTGLEPRLRQIGYLPQDYALFPHLSVRKNIAFGLRHHAAASAPGLVEQLMEQVGVAHLANRKPERLSGGEKQRVALARALAIRPKVLLLDEPVSALDESTRDALCRLLKQLQRETQTTVLHVCHNFAEMLAVADRVGIIHEGRIVQAGPPQEVLQRPRNALVARFVQAGNLFAAGDATVMVRPENIRLAAAPTAEPPPGVSVLAGRLGDVVQLGALVRVTVQGVPPESLAAEGRGKWPEGELELQVSLGKREWSDLRLAPGSRVYMLVADEDVHVMHE